MNPRKTIYHFFGQISRLRHVMRWSMKHSHVPENCLEHSAEVAIICHALCLIRNEIVGGERLDPGTAALLGLLHESGEAVSGDIVSPVKYSDPEILKAIKTLEARAERLMVEQLPAELQVHYRPFVEHEFMPKEYERLLKSADVIAALIKCEKEVMLGNGEFTEALEDLRKRLTQYDDMAEVKYFVDYCLPSYSMSFDRQMQIGLKPD